jgi:hypothetical protein
MNSRQTAAGCGGFSAEIHLNIKTTLTKDRPATKKKLKFPAARPIMIA